MKRERGLFEKLISDSNLMEAVREVNRTHHWKKGHRPNRCTAWVHETRQERVKELRQILLDGFEPKEPRVSDRYDASARKWRTVSEPAQWPDQYVHHALVQVLQPVMMRGMDYYCCGSIRGRGPVQAKKAIESWMDGDPRGTKHCFCGDIHHFYDSLQPEVVMARMRRLIKDHRTLDLIWRTIKGGVLIGAYTSQWFANTVLQPLDQLIRQSGLCSHYVRYMDNLTAFGPNKRKLHRLKELVDGWLWAHGLALKGDWQVFPVSRGGDRKRLPDAVGYRYGRGYTLPRKHNLIRLKRAVARYRRKKRRRGRVPPGMAAGILARLGQMAHCSNVNIYRRLFRGERIQKELKRAIREARKEEMAWSTYLEQRAMKRCSRQKEGGIPACKGSAA